MTSWKISERTAGWLALALFAAAACVLPPPLLAADAPKPVPPANALSAVVKEIPSTVFVGISRDLLPAELHDFQQETIASLDSLLANCGLRPIGPLHFMGPSWNGADKKSVFIIGYPVTGAAANITLPAPWRVWTEPAQRVATTQHQGPASSLSARWEILSSWASGKNHAANGHWREVFHRFDGLEAAGNYTELQLGLKP